MSYEEIYLNLYIALALALTLFAVLMVILSIWKRDSSNSSHANILPLLSGIPEDKRDEKGKIKDDTLSDT